MNIIEKIPTNLGFIGVRCSNHRFLGFLFVGVDAGIETGSWKLDAGNKQLSFKLL